MQLLSNKALLDDLFAKLGEQSHLVLAVSGGIDSLACLLLLRQWNGVRLSLAHVDHGLRPQSTKEAELLKAWCLELGYELEILHWDGLKPVTGIQMAAREARYRLLFEYTTKIGAKGLITAHHSDDQVETIMMRLLLGSGIRGLSGMKCHRMVDGLSHWRPLLRLSKAELAEICAQAGQPHIDDPSNQDLRFLRARLREQRHNFESLGLTGSGLLRLGKRCQRADAALDFYLESALSQWGEQTDGRYLLQVPEEIALRLLQHKLIDRSYTRLERLERVWAAIRRALSQGISFKTTFAGQLITLTKSGHLSLSPEPQRRRGTKRN